MDVIVYPSATDKNRNRGFAFVEYESHKAAAMARRKLIPGNTLAYTPVHTRIALHRTRLSSDQSGHLFPDWFG